MGARKKSKEELSSEKPKALNLDPRRILKASPLNPRLINSETQQNHLPQNSNRRFFVARSSAPSGHSPAYAVGRHLAEPRPQAKTCPGRTQCRGFIDLHPVLTIKSPILGALFKVRAGGAFPVLILRNPLFRVCFWGPWVSGTAVGEH